MTERYFHRPNPALETTLNIHQELPTSHVSENDEGDWEVFDEVALMAERRKRKLTNTVTIEAIEECNSDDSDDDTTTEETHNADKKTKEASDEKPTSSDTYTHDTNNEHERTSSINSLLAIERKARAQEGGKALESTSTPPTTASSTIAPSSASQPSSSPMNTPSPTAVTEYDSDEEDMKRDRMDMMKWWSARGTRGSSSSCPASHALTSKTKETLIKSTNAHSTSTITDLITDVETATIDSPPLAHTACQSCGKQASQVPPAAKLTTTTTTDTNAGEEKNHSLNVVNDEVKLRKCSRCRQVAYCSIECQKQDWKQGHRFTCKKQ